ncbi:MAG: FCD domain-containing protein [Oscillospiraceae bacterium]
MDTATKKSGREWFVAEFEKRIIAGELKAGEKIPTERELAAEFNLSKTVINSGMAELRQKGFILVRPRHGAYVADYLSCGNLQTLIEIISYNGGTIDKDIHSSFIEFRIINESAAAKLAATRRTKDDLQVLETIYTRLEQSESLDEIVDLAFDFHRAVFKATQNAIYPLLFQAFENVTKLLTGFSIKREQLHGFLPEMHLLIEAISLSDPALASVRMENLIRNNI